MAHRYFVVNTCKFALLFHLHLLYFQFFCSHSSSQSLAAWICTWYLLYVILLTTPVLKVIQLLLYDILMLLCIDCCSQPRVISRFYQGTVILCSKVTNKNITYNWPQDLSLRIATFSQQRCSLFSSLPVSQFFTCFAALLLCFIVA